MNLENYRLAKKCIKNIEQLKYDIKETDKLISSPLLPYVIASSLKRDRSFLDDSLGRWEMQLRNIERNKFGLDLVADHPEEDVKYEKSND